MWPTSRFISYVFSRIWTYISIRRIIVDMADSSPITIHELTDDPTKLWTILRVKQKQVTLPVTAPSDPVTNDNVRFVCISDTHGRTASIKRPIPAGDVLIHAGDITTYGHPQELNEFNTFLGELPHKYKIVIAGNHDFSLEESVFSTDSGRAYLKERFQLKINHMLSYMAAKGVTSAKDLLTNATYLEDSEVTVFGIRLYGSPWQPEFHQWAFNLPRGQPCLDKWNLIPEGVDVLITHGPPLGYGDLCTSMLRAGCAELLSTIQKRVRPKFHVCGHIHEGYGITSDGYTTFINASTCTRTYRPDNAPIVFDLPIPPGFSKD